MNTRILQSLIALALIASVHQADAQGTAFTYQGRLTSDTIAANGSYDLTFSLFSVSSGAGQVGSTYPAPATPVSNGLFTVTLDFGANFPGANRWLEISVRTNGGGAYTTLSPRQAITATPYAVFATTSGTASNLVNGSVVKSLNGLRDDVTLAAGTNMTITPNGNTLTLAAVGAGGSGIWSVLNNNAYYNAGNVGIGTTTPSTYGHGGTARILEVNNSGTTLNSQAHLMLYSGVSSLADSAMGTVTWAQPGGMAAYIGAQTRSTTPNMPSAMLTFGTRKSGEASATPKMFITEDGNVGIGSPAPVGKLEVVGQDALRLVGYNPFLTLLDSNAGYARSRIQGVGGDLDLFTESYLSGANPFSFLKLANNGNVGIGSSLPVGKLEVVAQDALRLVGYQPFLTILDSNAGYARSRIQGANGDILFYPESFIVGGAPAVTISSGSGNVGITGTESFGASTRQMITLYDSGVNSTFGLGVQTSTFYQRAGTGSGYAWYSGGVHNDAQNNPGGGSTLMTLSASGNLYVNGALSTTVLTIRGGSDVAEPFQMSTKEIPKGSVVVIDNKNPGQLKLSDRPYDSRVAGIVSGANGINPGIALHQDGALEGGQNVALSGRVYVLADASSGAIKPGDLLTTSNTPGHAMKVTNHAKAQGAILGKAMSSLKEGKGTVLVLVTLQ